MRRVPKILVNSTCGTHSGLRRRNCFACIFIGIVHNLLNLVQSVFVFAVIRLKLCVCNSRLQLRSYCIHGSLTACGKIFVKGYCIIVNYPDFHNGFIGICTLGGSQDFFRFGKSLFKVRIIGVLCGFNCCNGVFYLRRGRINGLLIFFRRGKFFVKAVVNTVYFFNERVKCGIVINFVAVAVIITFIYNFLGFNICFKVSAIIGALRKTVISGFKRGILCVNRFL